jgi:serine/threonine-protein kinase
MERIGRYEIVRELGRGSMSIVYEGFDGRIDRHLAIKVLRSRLSGDVSARQRFLREARAAGGLSHPNIVTVFDVGQAETKPYLVMELLPGGTLDEWLQAERYDRLTIGDILDIVAQISRALDYAHINGVIHRDIKPANVHYDSAAGQIKMMDFGIAAIEGGKHSALADDKISGTPSHMAPELILGHAADERSDLYSLGVVLYQLLSGKLPFSGTDCDTVLRQSAVHDTLPLHPTRPDTPRELIDLTYRLMALEPSSRPAKARQVVDEIEEIIDGRRRGILRTMRRQSHAWRGPAVIGSAVALVMVFGMSYIYSSQQQAMADATYGFGDALVSLVAQETAEALILEDATALAVLVSDFAVNPEVRHLHVSDRDGLIQASTNPYLKGESVPGPEGPEIDRPGSGIALHRSDTGLLEFSAPVRFQARRVGEVRLALDGSGLERTARATLTMLAVVFSAAMLAVLSGLWWITRRHQIGLRRLAWGLKRLQRGQNDFRFDDEIRDELSPAMREFNRLALQLEERSRREAREPSGTQQRPNPSAWVSGDHDSAIDSTLDLSRDAPSENDSPGSDDRVTPLRRHKPG